MKYGIAEIFFSIQGEGEYVGQPMAFVRLAGCNYSCPWCDTDYGVKDRLTAAEIVSELIRSWPLCGTPTQNLPVLESDLHVCLTGGEPTMYDLAPLLDAMPYGTTVHLESNGSASKETYLDLIQRGVHVVVSPKNSDGSASQGWVGPCMELKLVDQDQDLSRFGSTVNQATYWLQPLHDPDDEALTTRRTQEVVYKCISNPKWRVSVQLQKMLNLR